MSDSVEPLTASAESRSSRRRGSSGVLGRRRGRFVNGDDLFRATVIGLGAAILAIATISCWVLYRGGSLTFETLGFGFLFATDWDPVKEEFGALPFVVGTLLTSFGALVLAVPLAVASAVFITEYAPRWLGEPVSYLVELLAAIPSVVYGFWGIFVLVPAVRELQIWLLQLPLGRLPFLAGPPVGLGLFTAIIILTIMIIPFTAAVARDVIRLVPRDQREAAYALGATKWEVLQSAVLPYARAGIFGGVILSLGRALGETMAVTMVIGNRTDFASSLFGSTATMSSIIANEFTEAVGALHLSSLIAIGLVLFILSIVVNYLARILIYRISPKGVVS